MRALTMSLLFLTSVLCSTSRANPEWQRRLWVHGGGYFLDLRRQDNLWLEVINGESRYLFEQIRETNSVVVLYDRTRDMYVFLDDAQMSLTVGSLTGRRTVLYQGGWDNRRSMEGISATEPNAYVRMKLSGNYVWKLSIENNQTRQLIYTTDLTEFHRDWSVIKVRDAQGVEYHITSQGTLILRSPHQTQILVNQGRWTDRGPFGGG